MYKVNPCALGFVKAMGSRDLYERLMVSINLGTRRPGAMDNKWSKREKHRDWESETRNTVKFLPQINSVTLIKKTAFIVEDFTLHIYFNLQNRDKNYYCEHLNLGNNDSSFSLTFHQKNIRKNFISLLKQFFLVSESLSHIIIPPKS